MIYQGRRLETPLSGRAESVGLLAATLTPEVEGTVAPYLRIAAPLAAFPQQRYPGSPAIAQALLRRHNRLLLCELHPRAFFKLKAILGADPRAKLFELDGYMALRALVPPVERRGLVLIDPPYEELGELDSAIEAIARAWRKWASGIFALWYPVKAKGTVAALARAVSRSGMKRALQLEFQIDPPIPRGRW